VAVEPAESAVMIGKEPEIHDIQGIGEGFIPELVKMDMIDRVIQIKSQDAKDFVKELAQKEGLFVGISSGANVLAALKLGKELEAEYNAKSSAKKMPKKTIVTVLPDSGERYLSMNIFN